MMTGPVNPSVPDTQQARILIVDDQPANIALLEQMLREAGYASLVTTQDPCTVCELQRAHRFDLILLDLQMPGMDGFEVLARLQGSEGPGCPPVLVLTAQPDQKLRALKAGARDFVSKPFDLVEVLARVHNLLEVRLLQVETKRLYERVVAEQKVSERLLLNVLPLSVAKRLKKRSEIAAGGFSELIADTFPEVTVLFADIVGFTKFTETLSPELLVDVLNDLFSRFDSVADRRGLEKIKTIGDCYMAAAGLPVPVEDHPTRAAHMALDMLEVMDRFNEQSPYRLSIRIGISTGAAVAGVIGRRKFFYDLWGDVVNTASRMESQGVPGRIQLADASRQRLRNGFGLEDRGVIPVKGKGMMRTWFLNSRTQVDQIPAEPSFFLPRRSRNQSGTGLPTREEKHGHRSGEPCHSEIVAERDDSSPKGAKAEQAFSGSVGAQENRV